MEFLIELLVHAGVIFLLASIIPGINIKNYGTAILVCLVIGLLNATLGMIVRFPLNLMTLFLIKFIVRLFVTAIVIKITSKIFSGFQVSSWSAAIILAICMAIAGSLIDKIL